MSSNSVRRPSCLPGRSFERSFFLDELLGSFHRLVQIGFQLDAERLSIQFIAWNHRFSEHQGAAGKRVGDAEAVPGPETFSRG